MNYTKNRLRWILGSLAVSLLLIFALWVNSGFAVTEKGMDQRLAKQYMLTEFQLVAEGSEFDRLYKSGDELVIRNGFSQLCFYPLEGRAAFFPGTVVVGNIFRNDPECRAMELYAYDEIEGAVSVELEFWLRDELMDSGLTFERTYTPRCTEYKDGLAVFLLEQSEPGVNREHYVFNDLSMSALFGESFDGISYRATLRYYDAEGNLLDEVVREMLWE